MTAQPPNASLMERFVRHRVAANLVMIMMILAGAWAVRHVTTQFDPDVQWPGIWVEIHWPGAGAEDVEQMITIPVQQQLRTIADIKEVRSITTPGQSRMIVEMDHETDLTRALDSVKQQVANVRNLPAYIEPPLIYVDRNLEDIATLLVTSSREDIRIGDRILPMEARALEPRFFPSAPDGDIRGRIIKVLGGVTQVGNLSVVVLNVGEREGIVPGNVLSIWQQGAVVRDRERNESIRLPSEEAGLLMVFRVFDRVAYGLVLESRRPLAVLDEVLNP
jgi:hypothetical protein